MRLDSLKMFKVYVVQGDQIPLLLIRTQDVMLHFHVQRIQSSNARFHQHKDKLFPQDYAQRSCPSRRFVRVGPGQLGPSYSYGVLVEPRVEASAWYTSCMNVSAVEVRRAFWWNLFCKFGFDSTAGLAVAGRWQCINGIYRQWILLWRIGIEVKGQFLESTRNQGTPYN